MTLWQASLHFMSREDLCHIVNTGIVVNRPKPQEATDAAYAESIAYTLAYALFRRSVARARTRVSIDSTLRTQTIKHRQAQTYDILAAEFARTFESPDVQLVLANRDGAGPFAWPADAPEITCGVRWLLDQLHRVHREHMVCQADARACAFLASLDDDEEDFVDTVAITATVRSPYYSYELLHALLGDALALVRKMPDIPSPCLEPFYKVCTPPVAGVFRIFR